MMQPNISLQLLKIKVFSIVCQHFSFSFSFISFICVFERTTITNKRFSDFSEFEMNLIEEILMIYKRAADRRL